MAIVVALFLATTFTKSAAREVTARRYFTAEEIARGQRYSFGGRLLFWAGTALSVALLGALCATSPGAHLVRSVADAAGPRFIVSVLFVAGAVFAIAQVLSFPLDVYGGYFRQKAWGLTDRSLLSWFSDYAKALAVSAVIGAVVTAGFYFVMRHFPRHWWLLAGAGSGALAVFFAYIAPLVIAPLFNKFVPLGATAWADQEPRVRALLDRAKLPVREVLVMDASRQGRHTNAYFAGWGSTRRIVLYDTLLKSHGPEEIESILAHEIGHWTHHHIVKGVLLGTAGAFLGFAVLAWILRAVAGQGPLFVRSADDPAGLPLILLLAAVGGLLAAPLANAVSRRFETEADATSLQLGGRPEYFIDAEKRLVRDNIGDPTPSQVRVIFFATHPPALDRIAMAEAWRKEQQ